MRIGYVSAEGRGAANDLLAALATRLEARGVRLVGGVQSNNTSVDGGPCDMDLKLLPAGPTICISQSLGPGSTGCRLDTAALEEAVGLTGAALARGADILIVNKFGKHEAEGRGFRALIGNALEQGIPVVVGVNSTNFAAFIEFAGDFAQEIAPDLSALEAWVSEMLAPAEG